MAVAIAAISAAAACSVAEPDRSQPPATAGTTCPIAAAVAVPTFGGDILPMLRQTCGANSATSCHGYPSPVGHVSYSPSLSAAEVWGELVNVVPANAPTGAGWLRIAPNDPAHSWLVEKVTKDDPGGAGQAYGSRMPYGLPNLCDPTVSTIVSWIQRGAPAD